MSAAPAILAVLLVLAAPVQAADLPVGSRPPPLFKVTPLRDGRYLLEPLAIFGMEPRPQVNSQPNLNLPAARRDGGQPVNHFTRAGTAAAGSPAAGGPGD